MLVFVVCVFFILFQQMNMQQTPYPDPFPISIR